MNYSIQLPPLQVPMADPTDGLLPASALNRPLQVNIPIWETMQTGYSVQLMLDGRLVGVSRSKTDAEQPGDLMVLELPVELLDHDGIYLLAYRATNDKSEQHNDSPVAQLRVDRSAPGAALLAPLILASINFGESLPALVPGYADMAVGDTIQTLCNGVPGPAYRVESQDLTDRAMQLRLSRDFLASLNSETITLTYQVTDRAGNTSIQARAVTLSMHG